MDNYDPSLDSSNSSTPTNVATSTIANSDDVTSDNQVTDNASSHSGDQLGCNKAVEFDSNKLTVDKDCTECSIIRPDPSASQLVMYLHALSYQVTMVILCMCVWLLRTIGHINDYYTTQGTDWEFHTDLPSWASHCTQAIS